MTPHPLLDIERIDSAPIDYLTSIGDVFAVFGAPLQDSGNVSYGLRLGNERFFIKTAGDTEFSTPFADHAGRSDLLRNAADIYRSCPHPALACWRCVLESDHGPLLVYDWANGELLGHNKTAPDSALARFRRLPVETICRVLDQVYDAHRALAHAGWIAVDFYLGSIIYDFAAEQVHLIDLDLYHQGSFINEMGRMFGSSSLMAPEEFDKGALINQATNVFVMGRAAFLLLGDGREERAVFRGPDALFNVVAQACHKEQTRRFTSMDDFCRAWAEARLIR